LQATPPISELYDAQADRHTCNFLYDEVSAKSIDRLSCVVQKRTVS